MFQPGGGQVAGGIATMMNDVNPGNPLPHLNYTFISCCSVTTSPSYIASKYLTAEFSIIIFEFRGSPH